MNDTKEILKALELGDFTPYSYYADNYTGEKSPEVYDNLNEASDAFRADCAEAGVTALPLENYVNPITD